MASTPPKQPLYNEVLLRDTFNEVFADVWLQLRNFLRAHPAVDGSLTKRDKEEVTYYVTIGREKSGEKRELCAKVPMSSRSPGRKPGRINFQTRDKNDQFNNISFQNMVEMIGRQNLPEELLSQNTMRVFVKVAVISSKSSTFTEIMEGSEIEPVIQAHYKELQGWRDKHPAHYGMSAPRARCSIHEHMFMLILTHIANCIHCARRSSSPRLTKILAPSAACVSSRGQYPGTEIGEIASIVANPSIKAHDQYHLLRLLKPSWLDDLVSFLHDTETPIHLCEYVVLRTFIEESNRRLGVKFEGSLSDLWQLVRKAKQHRRAMTTQDLRVTDAVKAMMHFKVVTSINDEQDDEESQVGTELNSEQLEYDITPLPWLDPRHEFWELAKTDPESLMAKMPPADFFHLLGQLYIRDGSGHRLSNDGAKKMEVLSRVPPHFVHHSSDGLQQLRFDVSTLWRLFSTDYIEWKTEWPFEAIKTALYLDNQVRATISINTRDALACHSDVWQMLVKQVEWTADSGEHVSSIFAWFFNVADGMIQMQQCNGVDAPEHVLSPITDEFRRSAPNSKTSYYTLVSFTHKHDRFIIIVYTNSICVIDERFRHCKGYPPKGARYQKNPFSREFGDGDQLRGSGVGSTRKLNGLVHVPCIWIPVAATSKSFNFLFVTVLWDRRFEI